MLAALVGEPDRVTPAEMERWAKTFDNWGTCDTVTFVLWDRTPHAWTKVRHWSKRPRNSSSALRELTSDSVRRRLKQKSARRRTRPIARRGAA